MKKFTRFALGGAALAGAACGVAYFLQKVLGWDILKKKDNNDDIDDFDDDIDDMCEDDDSDNREYVTLDMEKDESKEDSAEDEKKEEENVPVPEEPVAAATAQ